MYLLMHVARQEIVLEWLTGVTDAVNSVLTAPNSVTVSKSTLGAGESVGAVQRSEMHENIGGTLAAGRS